MDKKRSNNRNYRLSGTNRSYASRNSANRNKRKKKNRINYFKLILFLLIFAALVAAIFFSTKALVGSMFKNNKRETVAEEVKIEKDVFVEGINISDLSRAELREELIKKYPWDMKAALANDSNNIYNIINLVESDIDSLLDNIYSSDADTLLEQYNVSFTVSEENIEKELDNMQELWNKPAKNGSISGFDKDSNSFIYAGEEMGVAIDRDKIKEDIKKYIDNKDFLATVSVTTHDVAPDISKEQAKAMYKVIGTFTTTTTTNKDRNTNIRLAAEAMDGMILQPGQEFSFNNTTGNRTTARGYKPAGAYLNGVLVEEPGGGVCQVSSTLYNAVIFSGLKTTERHAHTFEPSYVTPGEDAMVSYDGYAGPDMKFVNTSSTAIAIRAKLVDQKLTISIIGMPILEEGVSVTMKSHKVSEFDAPVPVYEEDAALRAGEEKIVKAETKGSRWVTNIITKKNDSVVSDEFFHNSTYKGKPATIKRNTTGAVLPQTDIQASSEAAANTANPTAASNVSETAAAKGPAEGATKAESKPAPTRAEDTKGPANVPPGVNGPENAPRATSGMPTMGAGPNSSADIETIAPHPGQ